MDADGKPSQKIFDAMERQMENLGERAKANTGIVRLPSFIFLISFSFQ
jgi:hypothetical protein